MTINNNILMFGRNMVAKLEGTKQDHDVTRYILLTADKFTSNELRGFL